MPRQKALRNILRDTRKAEQITQAGLARLVGVSIDTIRRWEAGTREPRFSEVKALAEVLGEGVIAAALKPHEEGAEA